MSINKTARKIRRTTETGESVKIKLRTSEKILARITEGIYREPGSALRELISNAYDADAQNVTITTDAPRFSIITIRDDGIGISPETLGHLIEHIGGSAKRTNQGKELNITSEDSEKTPNGRKLIGKLGIGLFAVAQFTRHFLIITKCEGENFRTIADVTLGRINDANESGDEEKITSGEAKIWTEPEQNSQAHGTEVKLMDLLPRTKAELCSLDRWSRIDLEAEELGKSNLPIPKYHIGRMDRNNPDELLIEPKLPWDIVDTPTARFDKFVKSIRKLGNTQSGRVDLDLVCDNYLQMIWNLALACPLKYIEYHPFDLPKDKSTLFFLLENKVRGQSKKLDLKLGSTPRSELDLSSPELPAGDEFNLTIDGIRLSRPILFTNQPKTQHAVITPQMFIGRCREDFKGTDALLSGGPLEFEAYLFWTPIVHPKQHQGVMLRVGNASGPIFDRTFMEYQVSEQNRLRQITAEIFVLEGLDDAINLDRETYNFAHPHFQFLTKWLHSAIRQLTNRNKALGKDARDKKRKAASAQVKRKIINLVAERLSDVGVEDVAEVQFIQESLFSSVDELRENGVLAFNRDLIFGKNNSKIKKTQQDIYEQKAEGIAQLLYGWGAFDELSYNDQDILLRDILDIVLFEE